MLSASHNPMPDNGIKLFARGGHKLPDAVEDADRARRRRRRRRERTGRPARASAGSATCPTRAERYVDAPARRACRSRSTGCGSSSTARTAPPSAVAPERLPPGRRRGASPSAASPDGWNINDGVGSTHLEPLHRGRASRTAPTSASPTTATPTAAWPSTPTATSSTATRSWPSARWRCTSAGTLHDDTVVATVMSNLGFHHAMRDAGIAVQTTAGRRPLRARGAARRRAVASAASRAGTWSSLDHATTGDGLLTGAARCWPGWPATGALAGRAGRAWCTRLPQVLVNVPVADRLAVAASAEVAERGRRRSRPSSATPAGCCCARPAPSSWCGSWSRRPTQEQADAVAAPARRGRRRRRLTARRGD